MVIDPDRLVQDLEQKAKEFEQKFRDIEKKIEDKEKRIGDLEARFNGQSMAIASLLSQIDGIKDADPVQLDDTTRPTDTHSSISYQSAADFYRYVQECRQGRKKLD